MGTGIAGQSELNLVAFLHISLLEFLRHWRSAEALKCIIFLICFLHGEGSKDLGLPRMFGFIQSRSVVGVPPEQGNALLLFPFSENPLLWWFWC